MVFTKTTNSLDRYDEIISKEFTLIDDQGNVVMQLSQIDFEQINNLAGWMQNNTELYEKLHEAQSQLSNSYELKIDSVNNNIIEVENKIESSQNNLLKQINSLRDELNSVQEEYSAYKRSINLPNDMIITKLPEIEENIKEVNDRIDAILEFDVMKKELKKNKKAYYLP
jgi:chromosome segregation ATPase